MDRKVVIVIGAGSTYADSTTKTKTSKPPLDANFFKISQRVSKTDTDKIAKYIKNTFSIDVYDEFNDSLEHIMVILYSDIFHPTLGEDCFDTFRLLVKLYNRRIAETTNKIAPSGKRYLAKIISHYLNITKKESDINFITFNQDLHIEKILDRLSKYSKYKKHGNLLAFPHCYALDSCPVTVPTDTAKEPCFDNSTDGAEKSKILKLHGSLNWYSVHEANDVDKDSIFNPAKEIKITRRISLNTNLKYQNTYTFPVIVPPVLHKASILHNKLKPIWTNAEDLLSQATDIVFYGYSCPKTDIESSNMIRRAISKNKLINSISLIDPNPDVANRYLTFLNLGFMSYYKTAREFLLKD